jgi:hypothetical protein
MACGVTRVPRARTTAPACTSSPRRRIHWPASGTVSTRTAPSCATHCSCITTTSAPAGICAPVKMRAAVPGCKGCGGMPAGIRWLTGSVVPARGTSAARIA